MIYQNVSKTVWNAKSLIKIKICAYSAKINFIWKTKYVIVANQIVSKTVWNTKSLIKIIICVYSVKILIIWKTKYVIVANQIVWHVNTMKVNYYVVFVKQIFLHFLLTKNNVINVVQIVFNVNT